jgi:MFS family permease
MAVPLICYGVCSRSAEEIDPLKGEGLVLSQAYKRYVLGTLTVVYTVNYLDRGLIYLLLQPIKEDLHLSDTELGFVTGIAFGLFYATLGLPIARWADRGNRVTIISIAIALWGGAVMMCLLVTNFIQLLAARVAAAAGEAGCMPPVFSLLPDYFRGPAEGTRAMTIYWLGNPLGVVISYIVGGWINELYGWRVAFAVMGIPALVLAALVKLTIAEPRTQAARPHVQMVNQPLSGMADVLRTLWSQRASRHLTIAIILSWTYGTGVTPWYAAFLMRSHGMGTAEIGVWFGTICALGATVGTLLGGYVCARWFANNARGQTRLSAFLIASLVPFSVLFLLLSNKHEALIALAVSMVLSNFYVGPTFALMQRLVIDEMRATTLAVVMALANLIGMAIGPQLVGIVSDFLRPVLGSDSLRYAIMTVSFVAFWSAYHFWQVGRTVQQDLVVLAERVHVPY